MFLVHCRNPFDVASRRYLRCVSSSLWSKAVWRICVELCWSRWSCGLSRGCEATLLLGLKVQIPVKVKVKQSHYGPWQTLRILGGWGFQISWQSAHEGGKVVSPTHRPPLPPRKYPWYSFLLEAIAWLEGLYQCKNPMTPSRIEPTISTVLRGAEVWGVQTPRNSEVFKKLSRILSSVNYTSIPT
jgi:hypothetical protein